MTPVIRRGSYKRKTKETDIRVALRLDGKGRTDVTTGIPFLDHMLDLFATHGLIDLTVHARGDLEVDQHHTVEDLGLALGSALDAALKDRKGIVRFASLTVPMDECLVTVAVDLGGRPACVTDLAPKERIVGEFDTRLFAHFLESFARTGRLALHVAQLRGGDPHHLLEATMKGLGRTVDAAAQRDPRRRGVPSSKGAL
ncbi:MAG: imidazoleglycerol-phosphate dehydratase HisB [Chloroflexota bacterium]|nr:imidazoleglycerol-phosphate dehydratase HisB [Chloroflexota bacterium]MDE3193769.1 imidazoleglycerol-phosphate dehydratase HisB [Chloroflexota bacterium]